VSEILDVTLFLQVFVTLFVIMDPPGTVPVFLALTSRMTTKQRHHAARQAILVAFGVVAVFGAVGQQLLNHMGVSLPALQASGGLLLLFVALELLTGKAENPEPARGGTVNVAIVPLGTPPLAGPGVIVATMVFVQQKADAGDSLVGHWMAIVLGVIAVHLCTWLAMRFAGVIQRVLRDSGVTLVTRIAGLLLAAIAIQMIADAVFAFIAAA